MDQKTEQLSGLHPCQECSTILIPLSQAICVACHRARWPAGVGSENNPVKLEPTAEEVAELIKKERTVAGAPSLPPSEVPVVPLSLLDQEDKQNPNKTQAREAGRSWEKLEVLAASVPAGEWILGEVYSIAEMLLEKNRKYGNSALNPIRIFSKANAIEQIKVRLDDKLSRIRSMQPDDMEDPVSDALGYLVLLRIAMWHT